MKSLIKKIPVILMLVVMLMAFSLPVFAAEASGPVSAESAVGVTEAANPIGDKALAAGICVGLAAFGGALGMGMAISKSSEGISRQPEAEGKIRTTLMLGLVFIETAIIYALIVAILVIFVL